MLGIIVTGHGNFATGIVSSMRLLAGEPQSCEAVDFLAFDSGDKLKDKLNNAVDALKECEGILILCDLAGGTPYWKAAEIQAERRETIEVLSGTNLGMLIEVSLSRTFVEELNELTEKAMQTGREQIIRYQKKEEKNR